MKLSSHWNTRNIPYDTQVAILRKAHNECDRWWVDELDCSKSFARRTVDMSFEDIMAKFQPNSMFNITHRHNENENYLEISFRSMSNPVDYFLWIILDPSFVPQYTEGLEPL